ncbi:MAG: hypothetical protein K8W52_24060, partial [Deltaproteobacteria bacterium]|nr:hypothetical protein [Deltaproteobacteria bacterium]
MTRSLLALAALAACHAHAPRGPAPDDRLWAAASEVIGDGRGHLPLPAVALVALPGDRALAFTDDGGLAEVDLATAQVTRARLAVLDGEVRAAVLMRGGLVLAVGGRDGRPAAWWVSPRELSARAAPLPGAGTSPLTGVAASPDGRAIVVTGPTWPLALRDPQTLAERSVVSAQRGFDDPQFVGDYLAVNGGGALIVFDPAHDARAIGRVAGLGFVSPDGAAIVVDADSGDATLIDLHGGPPTIPDLGTAPIAGVVWSPSGDRAAMIRADRIELVELPSGQRWQLAIPAAGARAVFSRDGASLLVTQGGGLWRADRRGAVRGPGPGAATIAEVSPGAVVSAAGWRALRGPLAGAWRPWTHAPEVVAVSPGGARVAAVDADGSIVRITDTATGAERAVPGAERALALAVDDRIGALVAGWAAVTAIAGDAITPLAIPDAAVVGLDVARATIVLARGGTLMRIALPDGAPFVVARAPGCRSDARAWLAPDGARLAIA